MKIKIPFVIWFLLLVIGLLEVLGLAIFYETLSWYDILLHGLGGLWVGLVIGISMKGRVYRAKNIVFLIALVAVIGILWEFFEIGFDASLGKRLGFIPLFPSVKDAIGDFFMDLAGAGASIFLLPLVWKKGKKR